jgi:DNA-directed RNA polymerase specialized sigma24 family protein
MDVERQLEELLPLLERVVASTCRRHALGADEGEDFASWVKVRLNESDYAVLRKFRGSSSLRTYLIVVVTNLFKDYRIAQWGKWRPSAAAKRAGDLGVQLEGLFYRDGRTFTEAVALLHGSFGLEDSRAEIESLATRLRPRTLRRFESDQQLDTVPSQDPTPLERLSQRAVLGRIAADADWRELLAESTRTEAALGDGGEPSLPALAGGRPAPLPVPRLVRRARAARAARAA